jgi:hypothetical protein
MVRTSAALLVWAPRVLAVAFSAFLGLLALDAFSETASGVNVFAFVVHLTPALMVLALVALAWRREWIGGMGFVALAAAYAAVAGRAHPSWVLVISGPLFIIGALYLWNWHRQRRARTVA